MQTAVLRLLTLLARYIAITSGRISVIAPANLHETRKISERPQMNRTKNGGSCKRSAKRSLCCRQWIGSWVGLLVVHIFHFAMGWVGVVDPRITLTCQVERRGAYSQRNSIACTAGIPGAAFVI